MPWQKEKEGARVPGSDLRERRPHIVRREPARSAVPRGRAGGSMLPMAGPQASLRLLAM